MIKENHHYIPQFYQKLFSKNKKSIGRYIIDKRLYIKHSSIRDTGAKKNYYGKNDSLENTFMKIEGLASLIIKEINRTKQIPPVNSEDYEMLMLFVLTFESRVQKAGDYENSQLRAYAKIMLEMEKNYGKHNLDDIDLDKVNINYTVPTMLNIKTAAKMFKIIGDLNCCLIISDTCRDFITSDNPVVRYNYMYNYRNYNRSYGLANMGLQLFIPISRKHCIYFYDTFIYDNLPSNDGNFHLYNAKEVDKLNLLFYMNSYEFLLFNNVIKEQYIKKLIQGNKNVKSSNFNPVVLGPDNKKLILREFKGVKKTINLPIFNIRKDLIKMPLPPHMGGPVRPYASSFIDQSQ